MSSSLFLAKKDQPAATNGDGYLAASLAHMADPTDTVAFNRIAAQNEVNPNPRLTAYVAQHAKTAAASTAPKITAAHSFMP